MATSDNDFFPSSSSAPSITSTPTLVSIWQATLSSTAKCQHIGCNNVLCKSTHVLPTCGHGMCHKHCMESGGCLGKGHLANVNLQTAIAARVTGTLLMLQRQPDSPRQVTVATTMSADSHASPSAAMVHITPNADEMRDPTRDPCFVSHMPDVFN
jgi:hypothetical protein